MLTPLSDTTANIDARARRRERRLWDQPQLPAAIGCPTCPQFDLCGGLHVQTNAFDCSDYCCRRPAGCTKVCRFRGAVFADHAREIRGFDLANVARAPQIAPPTLPRVVPVLFHEGLRQERLAQPVLALSLYALIAKKDGVVRFSSRAELAAAFGFGEDATVVLTGTDQDPPLERWWSYGAERRAQTIAQLHDLGIALVTTPNYSLFANVPRWDDLHSIKRIAEVHTEFVAGGLPTALHVNGRTERDFERWADYLRQRPEITHLAYEFGTGAGRAERMPQHVEWLSGLAGRTGRPLTLVVRGGIDMLSVLANRFDHLVYLDTSSFMKTMHRQRAEMSGNANLRWIASPTRRGASLKPLFDHNARAIHDMVRLACEHEPPEQTAA